MRTFFKDDGERIINFLELAHDDYLASRLLLLKGFLSQGCALASTTIEKYLKAILYIHESKVRKSHFNNRLLRDVEKIYPSLCEELQKDDFAKFLEVTYDVLRYAPVNKNKFSIVLNQYRTLMRLDATVVDLEKGFSLKKDGLVIETPLYRDIRNNIPILLKDNVILGNISKKEFFFKGKFDSGNKSR